MSDSYDVQTQIYPFHTDTYKKETHSSRGNRSRYTRVLLPSRSILIAQLSILNYNYTEVKSKAIKN